MEKFLARYPDYIEQRRADLNGNFDASDYPTPEAMVRLFSCDTLFYPIPDESHITAKLGKDISAAMKESLGTANEDRIEEAMASLWTRILKPINHLAEKLANPGEVFRDSTVQNIRTMLKEAPQFDFLKHPDVAVALKTIEETLAQVSPQTLRDDEALPNGNQVVNLQTR